MAALTSLKQNVGYMQLLHVDTAGGGNGTTLVPVKDGDNGTTFGLELATTKVCCKGSTLYIQDEGGESLASDGNNLTIAAGTSAIIDAGGDIILDADGADIIFKDGGTEIGRISNVSSDMVIKPAVANKDIIFLEDGGTEIYRLDSSEESLLMASSKKILFRDTAIHIASAHDGHLDITADVSIDMNGTVVEACSASFTTAGPTDNVGVSGVNTLLVSGAENAVTIGGLAGGVAGQKIDVVVTDVTNDVTVEHAEGGGAQDIYLQGEADLVIDSVSGIRLYCDGTRWIQIA